MYLHLKLRCSLFLLAPPIINIIFIQDILSENCCIQRKNYCSNHWHSRTLGNKKPPHLLFAHLCILLQQFRLCTFCSKHQSATYICVLTSLALLTQWINRSCYTKAVPYSICLRHFKHTLSKLGKSSQSPLDQRAFESLIQEGVILCVSESATVGNQCSPLQAETSGKNSCCASV